MLAAICQSHGYSKGKIELDALIALKSKIIKAISEGGELGGLKERRRDLLLPGWAVLVGPYASLFGGLYKLQCDSIA